MLGGLRVQLRLGDGYVRADARDTGLLLHAIFCERGRVGMNANGDALKAGHREYRLGVALGKTKCNLKMEELSLFCPKETTFEYEQYEFCRGSLIVVCCSLDDRT